MTLAHLYYMHIFENEVGVKYLYLRQWRQENGENCIQMKYMCEVGVRAGGECVVHYVLECDALQFVG